MSGETSEGMIWVPTARGLFGELKDWQLVRQEVAAEYDIRRWGHL